MFLQVNLFHCLKTQSLFKFSDGLLICQKLRSVFPSWCPAAHVLSSFLYMIGLFVRPQTQRERNVVWFSAAICGKELCVTMLGSKKLWGGCEELKSLFWWSLQAGAKGKNFTSHIVAKFAQLYSYYTSSRSLEIPSFQMGRNFFPIYLPLRFFCFYNGSRGVQWASEIWEFTIYYVEFSD